MAPPEKNIVALNINLRNHICLFERMSHTFKVALAGFEGPVTFNCYKQADKFVEFRAYMSLTTNQPNAKNCSKAVSCGSRQNFEGQANTADGPFFKFIFASIDRRPFLENEVLFISMQSELGCKLTLEPVPHR
jgi:hypothetical protein